jgi:hypothetical protein
MKELKNIYIYIVYLNKICRSQFEKKQRVVVNECYILSRDQVTLGGFELPAVIIELECSFQHFCRWMMPILE